MALINSSVPNLIGGVSQQPAALRFTGQAEEQENAVSSVAEGLIKRPPTKHLARVATTNTGPLLAHTINRDTTERYVVTLGDNSVSEDDTIRVFGIDGSTKDILDKAGDPANDADFAYLDCDDPTKDLKVLTVNDYTFIVNRKKIPAMKADLTTNPGNQALVTIVQGNYATKYTVKVTYGGASLTVTKTTADSTKSDIQTTEIASDLKNGLDGTTTSGSEGLTVSGSLAVLSGANGWSLELSGSTLLVKRTTTTEAFDISLEDSVGNGNTTLVKDTAQLFTDLPLVAPHGFITKIAGDPESGVDDYYVKFIADAGSGFANGTWEETVAPGIAHKLDPDLMPHLLLRQADNKFRFTPADGHSYTIGSDTYTVPEWATRQAGGSDTNPDPSFVGEAINDIFFFKNRLGFLAGEKVILSESAEFFNFFRTTITSLLDSAVIDVTAAHTKVSVLRHAIPYVEVLVLFSDQTQFVLRSEGLLTPKTVSITPSTEFESDRDVSPEANGDSIFFGTTRGSYAGVREYRDVSSQRLSFEATEISATVPTYITGTISKMASSTKEDVLVIQATGNASTLWVYKFFNNGGERVQSSWSKFTFGSDAEIQNIDFIDSTMYLLTKRTEGLFLESMDLSPGQADTDSTFAIMLDRRIQETACTSRVYSAATGKTTLTLPYNLAQVVTNVFPGEGSFYRTWDEQGGTCTLSSWALLEEIPQATMASPVDSIVPVVEMLTLPMADDASGPALGKSQDGSDASLASTPYWAAEHIATSSDLYPGSALFNPLAQITSADYTCAFSVYVKEPTLGAADTVTLNIYRFVDEDGTVIDDTRHADFVWSSGAITATSVDTGITATATSIGSGWYRLRAVYDNSAAGGAANLNDYLQARAYLGRNSGGGSDGTFKTVADGGKGTNFLAWGDPMDVTQSAWTRVNNGTNGVIVTNSTTAPPFYTATTGTYGYVCKLFKPGDIDYGTTPPVIVQSHTLTTGSAVSDWRGETITLTGYARVGEGNEANNTAMYVDLKFTDSTDSNGFLDGDGVRQIFSTSAAGGSWAVSSAFEFENDGTVNSKSASVAAVRQTSSANDANWVQFSVSVAYTPTAVDDNTVVSVSVFTESGGDLSGGDTQIDVWGLRLHGASSSGVASSNYYHRKGIFWGAEFEDGEPSTPAMQVVSRATPTVQPGVLYNISSDTTNTLVVDGDVSTAPLWIGEKYTKKYTFTPVHLQQPSQRGGMTAVLSGRYQLRYGTMLYEDSGYFNVKVTPRYQTAYEYPFTGRILGSGNNLIGSPSIESGAFTFPLMGKHDELTVEIENDSPLPSKLLSAEWEASYNPRSSRMG
jgi:hypothetical protein